MLSEGVYSDGAVQIKQFDAAGNSSVSYAGPIIVDQTPPSQLTLTVDEETHVASVGGFAEANTTWEYSLDGGNTWTQGSSDNTFAIDGYLATDNVQVRQIDLAGNVGDPSAVNVLYVNTNTSYGGEDVFNPSIDISNGPLAFAEVTASTDYATATALLAIVPAL